MATFTFSAPGEPQPEVPGARSSAASWSREERMQDNNIYVVCHNRSRFLAWCHDAGVDPRSVRQVHCIDMLMGRRLKREQVKIVQSPDNRDERLRFYDLIETVYVD